MTASLKRELLEAFPDNRDKECVASAVTMAGVSRRSQCLRFSYYMYIRIQVFHYFSDQLLDVNLIHKTMFIQLPDSLLNHFLDLRKKRRFSEIY